MLWYIDSCDKYHIDLGGAGDADGDWVEVQPTPAYRAT